VTVHSIHPRDRGGATRHRAEYAGQNEGRDSDQLRWLRGEDQQDGAKERGGAGRRSHHAGQDTRVPHAELDCDAARGIEDRGQRSEHLWRKGQRLEPIPEDPLGIPVDAAP
jgi:hypothetical protein